MHIAGSYLHSFAVPQCPLAASLDLEHNRYLEKSLLDCSFTDLLRSIWFCSWGMETKSIHH